MLYVVFEDDALEPCAAVYTGPFVNENVFGTLRIGQVFTLSTTVKARGLWWAYAGSNTGSPSDLVVRLPNASNADVMTPITVDKDFPGAAGNRMAMVRIPTQTLVAGTYRIVLVQTDTTTTPSNRYNIQSMTLPTGASLNWKFTSDAWTESTTKAFLGGIVLEDLPTITGSGGAGPLIGATLKKLARVLGVPVTELLE